MNEQEYQTLIKEFPAAKNMLEFNSGSWRNRPYWKFRRDFNKPLTLAEARHRLNFILANHEIYGQQGLKPLDGVPMPVACSKLRERLKGKTFGDLTPSEKRLQSAKMKLEKMGIPKVPKVEAPKLSQKEVLKRWEVWRQVVRSGRSH
jgi:hypothetical protein